MSDRWQYRLMDTYQFGLNRKARRDLARATRGTSSPRKRGPVPQFILLAAMALRERDHRYGSGLGQGGLQIEAPGLVDGYIVQEGPDGLSPKAHRKSYLRDVSDKGRVPGLR